MSVPADRIRPFDPAPNPGLGLNDFHRICDNGFGDGHNSFPHSIAWFQDKFYVGTTRSNFQMLKIQTTFEDMPIHLWPVEGPDDQEGLYREMDRRAQIWCYDPLTAEWEMLMAAPCVEPIKGRLRVARETGLRSMAVFQPAGESEPSLYAATWAVSRSPGALLLRSRDGRRFNEVSSYGIIEGLPVTATRVLVPFKDRLFTSPTGVRGHDVNFVINVSGYPVIFESRNPETEGWTLASDSGFGDPANLGVFTVCPFNDQLYAGTFNNKGFEVWRSDCEGTPPYKWTKVVDGGAGRGPENQIAATMHEFKGALYVGSAIQNGGHDLNNNIGPAASEVIRIHPDDSWDLIVGGARNTPQGMKIPLSAIEPGYGNPFNGYFWAMEEHDGWLYLGTMDTCLWSRFFKTDSLKPHMREIVDGVGLETIIGQHGGCDLWRTADGENWMPVTRTGFDNEYNYGIRNMQSTPHGLFVAVANPFGPRVAVERDGTWRYEDNPKGGLEIWLGTKEPFKRPKLKER